MLQVKRHLKDVWSSSVFSVCVAGLVSDCDVISSLTKYLPAGNRLVEWSGWFSTNEGAEGVREGPVEQVCNLSVI